MGYTTKYPHLFEPIRIGGITLKNRIVSAPTSLNWQAVDGNLTPETIAYYELKAKGGAAVVTLGESIVHSATGKSHDRQVELDNPTCLVSLTQLARAIKRHGAVPNIELSHGGKWGGLSSIAGADKGGKAAYGPSPEHTELGEVLEMPEELILEIAESFGKGAAVAKRAGFEMCLIHAAHGWLFGQFLSRRTNRRTDRFGGSFENRARFLMMALDSVRAAVGPGFPIEVRISGDEFKDGGIDAAEGLALAKLLDGKCDLINVSAGIHEDLELYIRTHPTLFLEPGCNVYLAEAIRKEVKVPISTVGGLTTPQLMEDIIAQGKADLVELARPLLADPYLPVKAREGRDREITTCLRCMSCFGDSLATANLRCAVNPVIGNEFNQQILAVQPTTPKTVLVAGGGPGGMEAAVTAASRGHKVILCEKTGRLGGALKFAAHTDFKQDLNTFAEHLAYRMELQGVEVRLNTRVTPELVEELQPDTLFIAVGAKPIIPPMPGIGSDKVVLAEQVYGNEASLGGTVVILGGGLVGAETAIHLARKGKRVTIVEMRDGIALDAEIFYRTAVLVELRSGGIGQVTSARGSRIADEGLWIEDADGTERLLKADTVVNAVGYRADEDSVGVLRNLTRSVHVIGDCRKPGKVTDAVFDGYYMAMDV